jgi:hypothetical protein
MGKYSSDKNIDSLVKELLTEGWSSSRKKRHWQLIPPTGGRIQTVPVTPSDGRAFMNFRGDIKRIKQGVKL